MGGGDKLNNLWPVRILKPFFTAPDKEHIEKIKGLEHIDQLRATLVLSSPTVNTTMLKNCLGLVVSSLLFASGVLAFDNSRNDNVAVYWGQNSYGATHGSDTANWQKSIAAYCQDDAIDAIPVAFLNVFFSTGGLPQINLANVCSADSGVFSGTQLANCQFLAQDIQNCQARGKIVTLSLGGATGAATFSSDSQAQAFADTIWNLFLGGSSSTRPFGNAVLDGVDLDIEGASKKYYVTAAPQCPFPDGNLGSVLNAVGFDAVYVQFYNNFCGLTNFNNPNAWNFATWDNWAKTQSPNKNVKIYIGAPASSTAAGSGFVDINTLSSIARTTRSQFSSFGGVMLWDASQAVANNRYDLAIKNALSNGGGSTPTSSTNPPASSPTSSPPTSSTPVSGSCAGVSAWVSNVAYVGGSLVTSNGHLWQAKWWSEADVPGGAAGDWTDLGACSSLVGAAKETGRVSTTAKAPGSQAQTSATAKATSAKAQSSASAKAISSKAQPSATAKATGSETQPSATAKESAAASASENAAKESASSRVSSRFFRN